MGQRSHRGIGLIALTSAAVIGLSLVGTGTATAGGGGHGGGSPIGTKTTIATGLNNPRQLSFTPWGDLLVAESGTGGPIDGAVPCVPDPENPQAPRCLGQTGSITKITARGQQSRIVTGLPSLAGDGGGGASGPSDVFSDGRTVSVLMGLGGNTGTRDDLGSGGAQLGTLIQARGDYSRFRVIADLAAWEQANNPINDEDSNPVGLLYDGGRYVVADAGGNDVLTVSTRGNIKLLATFKDRKVDAPPFLNLPPGTQIPMQAVPTSVATKGYDGSYYVSQLTGFPLPKGAANIYRIDPRKPADAQKAKFATGLTNVTDLAFDGRDLYVVQISTDGLLATPEGDLPTGSLVKIKPGGGAGDHRVIAGDLTAPYGIAIRNGSAYVTTGAVIPGGGEVIKIQLH